MRTCSECGYQATVDDDIFCPKCGARLPDKEVSPIETASAKKQKTLIIAIVALAVIAAIAVGVIIVMVLTGGSGRSEAPSPVETVTRTITDDVTTVAESSVVLEQPFNLRIASLAGSLPADLTEMKGMLDQITITVNNGVVSGSVSQPATKSDGTVISGQNTTLDIQGNYYESGELTATWVYVRPYGDTTVDGGGYIDSKKQLTKEDASGTISGTYNRAWSNGQVQTNSFGQITIDFAVGD